MIHTAEADLLRPSLVNFLLNDESGVLSASSSIAFGCKTCSATLNCNRNNPEMYYNMWYKTRRVGRVTFGLMRNVKMSIATSRPDLGAGSCLFRSDKKDSNENSLLVAVVFSVLAVHSVRAQEAAHDHSKRAETQETALDLSKKAQSLYQVGSYEASADAYAAAFDAGAVGSTTYYNAACSSALAGHKDAAFRLLDEAILSGWRDVDQLKADKDFSSLRSDERWAQSVKKCVAAQDDFVKTLKHPELYRELMEMKRVDQLIRSTALPMEPAEINHNQEQGHEQGQGHEQEKEHDHKGGHSAHGSQMLDADAKHTARMKEIVAKFGWPTVSMVSKDGATAAWLLVQHADADPRFQRQCLKLMQNVAAGEVSPGNVAYLVDRVLVNEGKQQLYGTQFWSQDGKMVPRPIEDRENLDKRRKEAGLGPFSVYEKHMSGPHDH